MSSPSTATSTRTGVSRAVERCQVVAGVASLHPDRLVRVDLAPLARHASGPGAPVRASIWSLSRRQVWSPTEMSTLATLPSSSTSSAGSET